MRSARLDPDFLTSSHYTVDFSEVLDIGSMEVLGVVRVVKVGRVR